MEISLTRGRLDNQRVPGNADRVCERRHGLNHRKLNESVLDARVGSGLQTNSNDGPGFTEYRQ